MKHSRLPQIIPTHTHKPYTHAHHHTDTSTQMAFLCFVTFLWAHRLLLFFLFFSRFLFIVVILCCSRVSIFTKNSCFFFTRNKVEYFSLFVLLWLFPDRFTLFRNSSLTHRPWFDSGKYWVNRFLIKHTYTLFQFICAHLLHSTVLLLYFLFLLPSKMFERYSFRCCYCFLSNHITAHKPSLI